MYLEYFKKYEMSPGDNPPVGILLCTGKDEEHVEFATSWIDDKIFVSQYLVALPDKKVLEQFIRKELDNLWFISCVFKDDSVFDSVPIALHRFFYLLFTMDSSGFFWNGSSYGIVR